MRQGGGKSRHSLSSAEVRVAPLLALLLFSLLTLSVARAADADAEAQLRTYYVGKVLTLRKFYKGEHLRFHNDGTLTGEGLVGPWTVNGQISVEDVALHGALLNIIGRRIYLSFDAKNNPKDHLMVVDVYPDRDRDNLRHFLQNLKVEVQIELPSENPDAEQLASTMKAVFLSPGESMVGIVPGFWRRYFISREGDHDDPTDPMKAVYYVKPGNGVSPPHATYQPEPEYSIPAQKLKWQGTMVMRLIIDPSGATRDIQIKIPMGLGLDESAVAAVSTWKFEPGIKDNQPVPVGVEVNVEFRLY